MRFIIGEGYQLPHSDTTLKRRTVAQCMVPFRDRVLGFRVGVSHYST